MLTYRIFIAAQPMRDWALGVEVRMVDAFTPLDCTYNNI